MNHWLAAHSLFRSFPSKPRSLPPFRRVESIEGSTWEGVLPAPHEAIETAGRWSQSMLTTKREEEERREKKRRKKKKKVKTNVSDWRRASSVRWRGGRRREERKKDCRMNWTDFRGKTESWNINTRRERERTEAHPLGDFYLLQMGVCAAAGETGTCSQARYVVSNPIGKKNK